MNIFLTFLTIPLSNNGLFPCLTRDLSQENILADLPRDLGEKSVFERLPDALKLKIIIEYLPDQVENRLVSKRIKGGLDKKYDLITKNTSGGSKNSRELINLKAVIILKSGVSSLDPIMTLKSENVNAKLVIRLIKELNLNLSSESSRRLSSEDLRRIFAEACSDPQDYDQVARIVFNYPDFMEMVNVSGRLDRRTIADYRYHCRQKSMLWLPIIDTMLCEMIYSNDAA